MASSYISSKRGLINIKQQTPGEHNISLAGNMERLIDKTNVTTTSLKNVFNLTSGSALGDVNSVNESVLDCTSEHALQYSLIKERTDMLFPQFLEVLQGRTNDSEVFDTIQDLIQTCSGIFDETVKDMNRSVLNVKNRLEITASWLEQEIKTWKLLYALYKDRIIVQPNDGMDCDIPILGGSEKEVISQLYLCNSTLREYQLIVDWLEACYNRNVNNPQMGHTTDGLVGWEHTLFQLQKKEEIAFGSGAQIVKSLDPDASLRENRPLHMLDEEENLRLSKCIFTEIRQGHIEEAMALCKNSGQTWRAAILEGWRLHEDPNYESNLNTKEKLPIEGNPRRDIWKKSAWLMADSKKFDEYSRAIVGVLCGHLESLKSLLTDSWEDLLWAYLKVQIDIRVETDIRSCCRKSYLQMPEAYWNGKLTLENIFDELSVHNDANVRDYAKSKVGTIQRYLILDNINELLQQMSQWVEEAESGDQNSAQLSSHLLRFLTHIVLFMRQIGRVDKADSADKIITAYVECLIKIGDPQLVAFYTAALPNQLQIKLYTKFLETVTESASRLTALQEAINAGLDIESITQNTVQRIRERLPNGNNDVIEDHGSLQVGEISSFDRNKIQALEWLTFLPVQRSELLWQANAMIRFFLGEGKAECVRKAFNMVPFDSVSQIIKIFGSHENIPFEENCNIKEYLSYKIYLTAIECFNDWSHLYHSRPKEPKTTNTQANYTERVADEHQEQVYRAEHHSWKLKLEEQTQITSTALYNVLLFPEYGWLKDPDNDTKSLDIQKQNWEDRYIQMKRIRSICIPEVVLLLHQIFHLSGDNKSCVKLVDIVADERRKIYTVYTKHKMAEFLKKIADSSLELLNKKSDPWGYNTSIQH